ncbi:MAG: DinB family protein [Ignavibacteria bacterium]|nr:DinB family protein [Ignavibacteria bacterium]
MQRPEAEEHNPYFTRYISLVPKGNYMQLLKDNSADIINFFSNIPEAKHNYRYAEGKWSIKDILMHITDTERVMMYRALVAARGDNTSILCNMEEDLYASNVNNTNRTLESILAEFSSLRTSTELFFENLDDEASKFRAKTETHPITARTVGYILIGHPMHHIKVIKERYLD